MSPGEVDAHRIGAFRLDRPALYLTQTAPERAVFTDNTPMFVQIAERLGMQSNLHVDHESTRTKLSSLGLQTNDAT